MGTSCSQECSQCEVLYGNCAEGEIPFGNCNTTSYNFHAEAVGSYPGQDCVVLSSGPATAYHVPEVAMALPRLALGGKQVANAAFLPRKGTALAAAEEELDTWANEFATRETWLSTDMPPLPIPAGDAPATMRGDFPDVPPALPSSLPAPKSCDADVAEGLHNDLLQSCGAAAKQDHTRQAAALAKTRTIGLDADDAPFVEMVFDVEGEEKSVQIFRRPLGAEFSKRSHRPTKVSKVDNQSYAWRLGIESGWIVKSVAGEDTITKTFKQTQEMIKSALLSLPVRTEPKIGSDELVM